MSTKWCPRCKQDLPLETAFYASDKAYCKSCRRDYKRERRKARKGYYGSEKFKEERRLYQRNRRDKLKKRIIKHYSNGTMKCCRCPYNNLVALSIDHIHSDGKMDREKHGMGIKFYRSVVKRGFPEGYQVLCMNCQWEKRIELKEFGNLHDPN